MRGESPSPISKGRGMYLERFQERQFATSLAGRASGGCTHTGDCESCVVRGKAICATLPAEGLAELQRIGRQKLLSKGQALLWEGEEQTHVATLVSGMLKLVGATPDGREQIVGLLGPGSFFGRLDGVPACCSVVALVPTRLCLFGRESFARFARNWPQVQGTLFERSLADLDRARRWLLMLGRGSAAERVAMLLVEFSGGDAGPGVHGFPLRRGQMADAAGLTIETVSRQLSALRAAGIIRLPNRDCFEIGDRDALLSLAGLDSR